MFGATLLLLLAQGAPADGGAPHALQTNLRASAIADAAADPAGVDQVDPANPELLED